MDARTINELMVGYLAHAESYYVKEGRPTSEVSLIRRSLRVLRLQYGHVAAKNFGPLALKACRPAFPEEPPEASPGENCRGGDR